MEDNDKREVKQVIDLMLDFLFYYSEDISIKIENEVNRILLYFTTDVLDEVVRTHMMRTIKGTTLSYPHSETIDAIAKLISDVRMETTDDETKILLIKNCEI